MGASSKTEEDTEIKKEIVDDISNNESIEQKLDNNKIAELKAKNKAKEQEKKMASTIIQKKERSFNFSVIGSGHAGSKLAAIFNEQGYKSIILNTALQDLREVKLDDSNKLLLNTGINGAAKNTSLGASAVESNCDAISELINDKLADGDIYLLCASLGGGSGSGSLNGLISLLNSNAVVSQKPIIVLAILPLFSDDLLSKKNALETLTTLTNLVETKQVNNIILIDNAKLELIYKDINQLNFFDTANKKIVDVLDTFNVFSQKTSTVKSLDSAEFASLCVDSEAFSIFSDISLEVSEPDDTLLASAIINSFDDNLLSGSFDLKTTKYVGVVFIGNEKTWGNVPSSSVNYAMSIVEEKCGSPRALFKGIYVDSEMKDGDMRILSFISGLGAPHERIEELKKASEEFLKVNKEKEDSRKVNLTINKSENDTISAAEKIKAKIAQKGSSLNKFINSQNVIDRRKK